MIRSSRPTAAAARARSTTGRNGEAPRSRRLQAEADMPMARPAAVWLRSWFSRACRTSPPSLTSEVAASRLARSSRRSRPGMEPRVAGRPYRALRVGFVRSDPVAPWLGRARPAPRLPLTGRMAPGCRRSSRRLPSAGKHRHVLPVPGKPQAPRATLGHGRPLTGKPQASPKPGPAGPSQATCAAVQASLADQRPSIGWPNGPSLGVSNK